MEKQSINIQIKQNFLRNQILEGGLDAQSFMDFMGTIKNQGQNIDLQIWSMQELKKVVADFKLQIRADQETYKKVQQSKNRQSQQFFNKIAKSVILKKQKVLYDKGLWDYEIIQQQTCKTIPKVFEFKENLPPKIHITKWQVRTHGGFFLGFGATKQLWVKIQTNFTAKPIERTNSDFEWLRNAMIKQFPSSYVPPLAQLRYIEPEDKIGLTNRSKRMQQFLHSVLKFDYLIQSSLSKQFFTETDHTKFTNFKNKEKSTIVPKNVGLICTLNGQLQLELSQKNQKNIKNCSGFSKVVHETYVQLETQINKILSDMQTLSKHVFYVSNSCGTLHQKYSKICDLNGIDNSSMQTLMVYLNSLFSNVGNNIKEQIKVIKLFSDNYIQFTIRAWQQFNTYDRRYQKQVQAYLNLKSDLIKKKQRFVNDFTKWQLSSEQEYKKIAKMDLSVLNKDEVYSMMFPRQNKLQEQVRLWIAYVNKIYVKSFRMVLEEEETQLKQNFRLFSDHYRKVSEENNISFNQFKQILA